MTFEPYLKDRLIERHENYVVIVPKDVNPTMPLACPVCDYLFCSKEDEDSYEEFYCCDFCSMTWAYSHRKQWEEGWRPSESEVKEKMSERQSMTVTF